MNQPNAGSTKARSGIMAVLLCKLRLVGGAWKEFSVLCVGCVDHFMQMNRKFVECPILFHQPERITLGLVQTEYGLFYSASSCPVTCAPAIPIYSALLLILHDMFCTSFWN